VKQVLTSFASYGQAAWVVRARPQAALHGRADRDIFFLYLLADDDALEIGGRAPSEMSAN
jgi:hypothetical protein